MPSLYNCKHSGDQYRISKFDSDFNLEASYLCDLVTCECPAGHRPSCRHRQMLPKFIQRNYVGTEYFFDFDRGGWVQGWKEASDPYKMETNPNDEAVSAGAAHLSQPSQEPSLTIASDADGLEDETQYDGDIPGTEESRAPEIDQASEVRPSLFVEMPTTAIVREGLKYPIASPKPTIRRRV